MPFSQCMFPCHCFSGVCCAFASGPSVTEEFMHFALSLGARQFLQQSPFCQAASPLILKEKQKSKWGSFYSFQNPFAYIIAYLYKLKRTLSKLLFQVYNLWNSHYQLTFTESHSVWCAPLSTLYILANLVISTALRGSYYDYPHLIDEETVTYSM